MATANVRNVLRMPARLAINPTNLTAGSTFPHGGTALGLARRIVFYPNTKTDIATAEEWGGIVTKAYYAGEKPYLAAVLREFDNDALNNIFPNTTTGTITQDRFIRSTPGTSGQNRHGYDLTGKVVKLLAAPISPNHHRGILIWYAIPAMEETMELRMSLNDEIGLGVVWWAGLNSGNQCWAIGKLPDLQSIL